MEKSNKFILPPPVFERNAKDACKAKPHYLTPSGMSLLPREKQPPPMYGKHGATLPGRFLKQQAVVKDQIFVNTTNVVHPPEKQYCEPCELELQSIEDLKRHRAQHEKCPVAGCHYKGHPTVMDKHINALHASGLFDKFKKLSTPEEIAAWRAERRKRYPTLANVLLKQKAKEQRQKRGECLDSSKSRFGKVDDRKRAQQNTHEGTNHREENAKKLTNNKRNRKNKNKKSNNQHVKIKVQANDKQKNENLDNKDEPSYAGIKMFRGTSQLEDYKHFNAKTKSSTNNALFGLVGMYGSDEDDVESEDSKHEDDDKTANVTNNETVRETEISHSDDNVMVIESSPEQTENNKIVNIENKQNELDKVSNSSISEDAIAVNEVPGKNRNVDLSFIKNCISNKAIEGSTSNPNEYISDEAPEEIPIQRSNPDYPVISASSSNVKACDEPEAKRSKPAQHSAKPKQKNIKQKFGLDYRKARLRKQNTMLEKLLEPDIRHERNVLLQCVRFVCENNFFNVGHNKKQENLAINIS